MKPIISVKSLGKRYTIRQKAADAPTNFREALTELPRRIFKGGVKATAEDFWALNDVNFDIMPGDRVGIIGRNGAGKSTLLKLLSRITEPTTGKITMRGRAASLLEVGTGFHPELSGRENIYLNGAILGMTRTEVTRKFDEIVDFSGVEKFLDTPVKRYSSGMYVRLGFAVAAHLEPDILIVDEVLAVGDADFQKKCLGKMEEVSKGQGRTVLFVSHSLGMVSRLCLKAMLFEQGNLLTSGNVTEVLGEYAFSKLNYVSLRERVDRKGSGGVRFTSVEFFDANQENVISSVYTGQKIVIKIGYEKKDDGVINNFNCALCVSGIASANDFFTCSNKFSGNNLFISERHGYIYCIIEKWPLGAGQYGMRLFCESNSHILDWIDDVISIDVECGRYFSCPSEVFARQDTLLIESSWGGDCALCR